MRQVAGMLAGALAASVALAQAPAETRFESEPPGAQVCEKRRGEMFCMERTPFSAAVDIPAAAQDATFYVRKLGFAPARVTVGRGERAVRVRLQRRDVFDDGGRDDDAALGAVRERAFAALRGRIYGAGAGIDDSRVDLVGGFAVVKGNDGYYLVCEFLLSDDFRRQSLRGLRNVAATTERERRTALAVIEFAGADVVVRLAQALAGVEEITGLIARFSYRKSRSVLAEDIDRYTTNRTWQTTIGNTVYQHVLIRTHNVGKTVVTDVADVYGVIVRVDPAKLRQPGKPADRVLAHGEVLSNDNRAREFRPLSQ